MMDRFDLRIDMPQVTYEELALPPSGESSAQVAELRDIVAGLVHKDAGIDGDRDGRG